MHAGFRMWDRISRQEAMPLRIRRRNRRRYYCRMRGRISSPQGQRRRMQGMRCFQKGPGRKRRQPARPEGPAARRDSDGLQPAAGPSAADTSAACAPSSKTTRTSPSCRQGHQDPAFHTNRYRRSSSSFSFRSSRKGPFRSLLPYSIASKGDIFDCAMTSSRLLQAPRFGHNALAHPTTVIGATTD